MRQTCREDPFCARKEYKMELSNILSLICGVAFFLFGMTLMSGGLKAVAGPRAETYLRHLSSTPVKGFLLGTMAAAVIQSSSATSVMTVSFVDAGMMRFAQAICVILGANVGTTMTGWLLTLSEARGGGSLVSVLLGTPALVTYLALAGIAMYMFARKKNAKKIGTIFLGLGTLLLAMILISDAVGPLKESEAFRSILTFFENPFFGILAGIVVAAILQSSSASVGILQALCVTGVLPYSACIPLILGINVGASAPVLLSMVGGTRDGKRTALSYLIVNLLGIPVLYILYLPLRAIVGNAFFDSASTVFGIAVLNTAIRLVTALILLPLHKLIEKLCCLILPVKDEESEDSEEIDGLDDRLLNYTPAAIEKSERAAVKMFEISKKNVHRAIKLLSDYDRAHFQKVEAKEQLVDKYEDKLNNFVVKVSKNSLSAAQQAKVSELLGSIVDFERLSDHAVNLAEVAQEMNEKKVVFSKEAQSEIKLLIDAVDEILNLAYLAYVNDDREALCKIEPLEETVDVMCRLLRARHIERLQNDHCTILSGFILNDILANLERVSDHCNNICFSVRHGRNLNEREHDHILDAAESEEYKKYIAIYEQKYVDPLK